MTRESLLARTLVQLADTLVDDFDVVDLLTLLTSRCVEATVADAAGLLLRSPDGSPGVVASSTESMHMLELLQLQAEEGPCFDCLRAGEAVLHRDLAAMLPRWPTFAAKALGEGFVVVHALPMRLRSQVIGALNLFQRTPAVLDDDDLAAAQAFADVATIGLLQHRAAAEARLLTEQLSEALRSRVVIEQAKGVIAERLGIGVDDAYRILRTHARDRNRRLTAVADDVVSGVLSAAALDAEGATPPHDGA